MKKIFSTIILLAVAVMNMMAADDGGKIATSNVNVQQDGRKVVASFDIILDDVKLGSNHQLFVTPYLEDENNQKAFFPTVLVNGRNMQYVYERSGLNPDVRVRYNNINKVVRRKNGTVQHVSYTEAVAYDYWMHNKDLTFRLAVDSCGCGDMEGASMTDPVAISFAEPVPYIPVPSPVEEKKVYKFYTAFITPRVTEQPVGKHEGKARVQFEVNKTELHTEPYTCKSGQKIDNRQQLQIICDSIDYALSDPNVELANINVCGFASPESPYTHNEYLATNRSRALAEYISGRYSIPQENCTYNSVPENWAEFREQVLAATDITEKQREDLLELIDKQTYGPSDFDAKEKALKTDPRYAKLYKDKILPVWFPELRCTKFVISTRLKPASDEQLAEIIKKTPELLSLNQMFRVALLYPEGSKEFNETFETALRFYGDDPVANLNAAVAAIKAGEDDKAARFLSKAGNSPEAENARGVIAAHKGDLETALNYFKKAGALREAQLNRDQIEE